MPPIRRSDANIASRARSTSVEVTKQRARPGTSSKSAVKENRVTTTTTRANEQTSTTTKSKTYDNKRTGARDQYDYKSKDKKPVDQKSKAPEGKTVLGETDLFKPYEAKSNLGVKGERTVAGGVNLKGYAEGPSFKLEGKANAEAKGLSGVDVNVDVKIEANLLKAGGSAEKEFKFKVNGEDIAVKINLEAKGQVGMDGSLKLKLHVGKDGVSVSAGAEGFAGAKGSLTGEITTSINGKDVAKGSLGVTAAAGAMAGAEFEAGLTHFKAKAYAAVGVGMGIDISGEVNAGNLAKEVPGLLTTWDD
jgi:hypothetical protein